MTPVQIYSNPSGIITATVVTEVLAVLSVGLRFYSRRWRRQKFITSDWLILVALVIGSCLTGMEVYGVHKKALGYPIGGSFADPIVNARLDLLKRLQLSFVLIGIAGAGFVKLSVCLLCWHLFSRVVFRRFLAVWTTVVALWMVSFILAGLLECGTHLTALFGSQQGYEKYCRAAIPSGYAMMASDMTTDFVTLVIPIPVVLSLTLDRKTKALTLLTFMIGSLSVGASIAKTYIFIVTATGNYTEDAMLLLTGLSLWNLLEVQIGIIAACGPTLRQILTQAILSPTTSSIKSLISLLGSATRSSRRSVDDSRHQTRKQQHSDEQLPSFVKLPSAEGAGSSSSEHLHGGRREYEVYGHVGGNTSVNAKGGFGQRSAAVATAGAGVGGTVDTPVRTGGGGTGRIDVTVGYEMESTRTNSSAGTGNTRKYEVQGGESMV